MISRTAEIAIAATSVTMFVATLAAIPVLVVRLPSDYFVRPPTKRSVVVHVVRNVLGALLIAFGLAMLVLPGQGILTILIGLSIVDLPIKHRIMGRLLRQPKVAGAIQAMRRKAGKEPLIVPEAPEAPQASPSSRPSAGSTSRDDRRSSNRGASNSPPSSAGSSHA